MIREHWRRETLAVGLAGARKLGRRVAALHEKLGKGAIVLETAFRGTGEIRERLLMRSWWMGEWARHVLLASDSEFAAWQPGRGRGDMARLAAKLRHRGQGVLL